VEGEQVPRVQPAAVGNPVAFQERSGSLQHLGLVDQDAPGPRGGLQQSREQGAGPAGDVGDRA
jgi:hypothetical protein